MKAGNDHMSAPYGMNRSSGRLIDAQIAGAYPEPIRNLKSLRIFAFLKQSLSVDREVLTIVRSSS